MNGLIRGLVFRLVRLFYAEVEVRGRERLRGDGPTLFVLNHPNGLLDPLLLMVALRHPVSFLAKSTFFGNPAGRWLMQAFGALPVYRKRDEGKRGGPEGDAAERNEQTFARCRRLLRDGAALALFPEGTTHSEAQLLPLRTGAARIALSAEAEAGWTMGLRVVPVGLWYAEKTRFRSAVVVVVGEPFSMYDYEAAYAEDERSIVQAATDRIEAGLDAVVLQAENADLLTALPVVAAWTLQDDEPPNLAAQHAWATTLLDAYHALHRHDPDRLEAIAHQARRYAERLRVLGVDDPWQLEMPSLHRGRLFRTLAGWVLAAPLALLGFLVSYGPYRLAGPVATAAVRGEDALLGTFKLIVGSVFVLLGWIVEAVIVGGLVGWVGGVLLFAGAPLAGYVALRWGEVGHAIQELITYEWLRVRRHRLVELLAAQRRALAADVRAAVQTASEERPDTALPDAAA